MGKHVFTAWLLPVGFGAKFAFARRSASFSVALSLVTSAAMTLGAWMLLIVVPLPLVGWTLAHEFLLDLGVARIGFGRRLRRREFAILLALNLLCLGAAVYWTARGILRHPVEA
jgi:hypothetical protein